MRRRDAVWRQSPWGNRRALRQHFRRSGYAIFVDELLSAIERLAYPATRQDLVAALLAAGADDGSLARIESLPRERYDSADELSRDLVDRRAESNPSLVAIVPEPCEECGFPRFPGKPHSCIEEKARFAESAKSVTDEFEIPDGSSEAGPARPG